MVSEDDDEEDEEEDVLGYSHDDDVGAAATGLAWPGNASSLPVVFVIACLAAQ